MAIKIDNSKCIQCIGCASVCPQGAIELDGLCMKVDPKKCIGCGICVKGCPANAIKLVKEDKKKED